MLKIHDFHQFRMRIEKKKKKKMLESAFTNSNKTIKLLPSSKNVLMSLRPLFFFLALCANLIKTVGDNQKNKLKAERSGQIKLLLQKKKKIAPRRPCKCKRANTNRRDINERVQTGLKQSRPEQPRANLRDHQRRQRSILYKRTK